MAINSVNILEEFVVLVLHPGLKVDASAEGIMNERTVPVLTSGGAPEVALVCALWLIGTHEVEVLLIVGRNEAKDERTLTVTDAGDGLSEEVCDRYSRTVWVLIVDESAVRMRYDVHVVYGTETAEHCPQLSDLTVWRNVSDPQTFVAEQVLRQTILAEPPDVHLFPWLSVALDVCVH